MNGVGEYGRRLNTFSERTRQLANVTAALRNVRQKYISMSAERGVVKHRVRDAVFMSRNYRTALRNFARLQQRYDAVIGAMNRLEKKWIDVHRSVTRAEHALDEIQRRVPGIAQTYENMRHRAARTIQKRILNRRAVRVLGTLNRTGLSQNLASPLARSILRTRS